MLRPFLNFLILILFATAGIVMLGTALFPIQAANAQTGNYSMLFDDQTGYFEQWLKEQNKRQAQWRDTTVRALNNRIAVSTQLPNLNRPTVGNSTPTFQSNSPAYFIP